MKRISPITVLLALLAAQTCYGQTPDKKEDDQQAWSEPVGLDLKLEWIKKDLTDWYKNQLKLTVTNTGKKDIVIDKELVIGISLHFCRSPRDPIFDEEKDITWNEVKKLSKPKPEEAAKRFVKLQPGKSLSRVLDLSQPINFAHQGHITYRAEGGGLYHVGRYYEAQDKCQFPKIGNKFEFTVWYESAVWWFSTMEFEKWHGISEEKAGLSPIRAHSNLIIMERK